MGWDNLRHTIIGTIAVASIVALCVGVALQMLGDLEPPHTSNCIPYELHYC